MNTTATTTTTRSMLTAYVLNGVLVDILDKHNGATVTVHLGGPDGVEDSITGTLEVDDSRVPGETATVATVSVWNESRAILIVSPAYNNLIHPRFHSLTA